LKKEITFAQGLATLVGSVIGAGVFFKIGTISHQTNSAGLTIFVWLLAGFLSLASGLTIAEVAAELPVNGSIQYLEYTYGSIWGFLFGWAQIIVYFPAEAGASSSIFGTQASNLFGNKIAALPISLCMITFIFLTNLLGTKFSSKLQSIVTVIKVIPLILIIIFGLMAPEQHFSFTSFASKNAVPLVTAISGGLLSALFAFDGWVSVTNLAGDLKNPQKDMAKILIWGLGIVTAIYVLVNFVFLKILPFNSIFGNQNTAFNTSIKLFGNMGGKLVTIGILISCYGAANAFMLTGMRAPYILAQNNLLPFSKKFKQANKKTGVPVWGAVTIWIITMLMISLGNFDILTDMLVFVMWFFTIMLTLCQPVLRRRKPNLKRPFKVPFYPITPIIALAGGIFIIIMTIINQFWLSLIGSGLTALGLPIYFYKKKQNK
jgi:amino acid permease